MRLDEDSLLKSVELSIHAPQVHSIGRRSNSKGFSHFQCLQRAILLKSILYDLEVIKEPTVIRITVLHVNKCLEVYDEVKQRTFFFELLEIIVIEDPKRVIDLILI